MAESIGKAYVTKKGLEDLTVISSGTVVKNSIWTYERANRMITQANKAGFLEGAIVKRSTILMLIINLR